MPAPRLKHLYVIATVALALPAVTACDSYKEDVATVQAAESRRARQDQRRASPAKSPVPAVRSPGRAPRPSVTTTTPSPWSPPISSGSANPVQPITRSQLEFINNRETRKVAFEQAYIDGKPQSLLGGALTLFMMQLD